MRRTLRYWRPGYKVKDTSIDGRCCAHCNTPCISFYCERCYRVGMRRVVMSPKHQEYMIEHERRLAELLEDRGW